MLVFFLTLIFSFRWGEMRHGGLMVAGFNLFAWVTGLLFIFLVRKAQGATAESGGGFSFSASSIYPWTFFFGIEILVAFVTLQVTSPSAASGFLLLAVLGVATGILMGSPRMGPRERTKLAFAVGYIATFAGTTASIPFVYLELRPAFSGPDLIPVIVLAGLLSAFEGGMCTLGSLLGGVLRARRAAQVATA